LWRSRRRKMSPRPPEAATATCTEVEAIAGRRRSPGN
jgi:hypothetical protein